MAVRGEAAPGQSGRLCEEAKGVEVFVATATPFWPALAEARDRLRGHLARPYNASDVWSDDYDWNGVTCVAAIKMATELAEAGFVLVLNARLPAYLARPDTPASHVELLEGAHFEHRQPGEGVDLKLVLASGGQVLIAQQQRLELTNNTDTRIVQRHLAELLETGEPQPCSFRLQAPVAAGLAVASLWFGHHAMLLAPDDAVQLATATGFIRSDSVPRLAGGDADASADSFLRALADMVVAGKVPVLPRDDGRLLRIAPGVTPGYFTNPADVQAVRGAHAVRLLLGYLGLQAEVSRREHAVPRAVYLSGDAAACAEAGGAPLHALLGLNEEALSGLAGAAGALSLLHESVAAAAGDPIAAAAQQAAAAAAAAGGAGPSPAAAAGAAGGAGPSPAAAAGAAGGAGPSPAAAAAAAAGGAGPSPAAAVPVSTAGKVSWRDRRAWLRAWWASAPAALARALLGGAWPRRVPDLPSFQRAGQAAQYSMSRGRRTLLEEMLPECPALAAQETRMGSAALPDGSGTSSWGQDFPPDMLCAAGGIGGPSAPQLAATHDILQQPGPPTAEQPQAPLPGRFSLGVFQCGGSDPRAGGSGVIVERSCWADVRFGLFRPLLDLVASPQFAGLSGDGQRQRFAEELQACGGLLPWVTPLLATFVQVGALSGGSINPNSLVAAGCVVRSADILDGGARLRPLLLAASWAGARHAPALAQLRGTLCNLASLCVVQQLAQRLPNSRGVTDVRLRTLGAHSKDVHNASLSGRERDEAYAAALAPEAPEAAAYVRGEGGTALLALGRTSGVFSQVAHLQAVAGVAGCAPWPPAHPWMSGRPANLQDTLDSFASKLLAAGAYPRQLKAPRPHVPSEAPRPLLLGPADRVFQALAGKKKGLSKEAIAAATIASIDAMRGAYIGAAPERHAAAITAAFEVVRGAAERHELAWNALSYYLNGLPKDPKAWVAQRKRAEPEPDEAAPPAAAGDGAPQLQVDVAAAAAEGGAQPGAAAVAAVAAAKELGGEKKRRK